MFTRSRIWVRVLFGVLALALIIGGGMFLFRVGYSRGAMVNGAEGLNFGDWDYMHGYSRPMMGYHYFPFGGFLFGFFFLVLIFGLMRRAIFGPRWGWGSYSHHGKFRDGMMEEMHTEMHKRMDEAPSSDDTSSDTPDKQS
jgi:hypothetical protein